MFRLALPAVPVITCARPIRGDAVKYIAANILSKSMRLIYCAPLARRTPGTAHMGFAA